MKYIKKYEYVNRHSLKPKMGDFVICKDPSDTLKDFLSNNIGQIVDYNLPNSDKYFYSSQYKYIVKYDNVPKNLKEYFADNLRGFKEEEIMQHSKTKKDLELLLAQNKRAI